MSNTNQTAQNGSQTVKAEILDDDAVIDATFTNNDAGNDDGVTIDNDANNAGNDNQQDQNEARGEPSHSLVDVPDYQLVDDDMRAIMDGYIETIDPRDIETIINLGREELERLSSVAKDVRSRIDADAELLDTFEGFGEQLEGIDLGGMAEKAAGMGSRGVKWAVKNPGAAVATAGTAIFAGPAALGIPYFVNKRNKAKARKDGTDLADRLRETVQSTDEVVGNLRDAQEKIPRTIQALNELGKSRVVSYQAVSIVIGAAVEKLRRIDEYELPALQAKFDANGDDFELQIEMSELNDGRDELDRHINDMFTSRTVSQVAATSLAQLKSVFTKAAGRISRHLTVSVPQWDAQMAEAGVLLVGQKITQAIDEADERGNKILEEGAALTHHTALMIENSSKAGSYDADAVIAVLETKNAALMLEAKNLGEDRAKIAQVREQVSKAAEKHSETVAAFNEKGKGRNILPDLGNTGKAAIAGPEDGMEP